MVSLVMKQRIFESAYSTVAQKAEETCEDKTMKECSVLNMA